MKFFLKIFISFSLYAYFQVFHVPVLDSSGNPISYDNLCDSLRKVVSMSEPRNETPVGIVSAGARDKWATIYEKLKGKILIPENEFDFVKCSWFRKIYSPLLMKHFSRFHKRIKSAVCRRCLIPRVSRRTHRTTNWIHSTGRIVHDDADWRGIQEELAQSVVR